MEEAEGVREGPESETTDTPESVRSAGGRRELERRPPAGRLPELPPSLLVPATLITHKQNHHCHNNLLERNEASKVHYIHAHIIPLNAKPTCIVLHVVWHGS